MSLTQLNAISPIDGSSRIVVQSNLYAGNAYGVAIDSDGGYLLVESHQVEKFTVLGGASPISK